MLNVQMGSLLGPIPGIQGGREGKQKKTKALLGFLLDASKTFLTDALCDTALVLF